MFKLFGAIGRFFRAILYTFAGDVSKWSEVWESSPAYVHAEYDEIKKSQQRSLEDTTNAVASLLGLVSEKEGRSEKLNKEIEELQRKMAGAKSMADNEVKKLKVQGVADAQIMTSETVVKCLHFYDNFATTIKAKREELEGLTKALEKHHADVAKYKIKLQSMHSELQKIKAEEHETVADLEIAKQEKKVNDALLGISSSDTEERRGRIQELRKKARAQADITSELAGVATSDSEAEFLNYAAKTETQNEFFGMLGLKKEETVSAPAETVSPVAENPKLPE